MIPIFQKIFDLISSEEFCFLYVEPAKDGYGNLTTCFQFIYSNNIV
jgi:hypothetical protein